METDVLDVVVIVSVAFLSGLVFLESVHRARKKLPLWRVMAEVARRNGFQLEESSTISYGVPEVNGTVTGRPIVVRVTQGSSTSPVTTAISVGQRLAVRDQVIMVRGSTSRWPTGSPRWKEARIVDPEAKREVRITGHYPEDVDQVVASIDDHSRSVIVESLYDRSVLWMRFYKNRFDCYLHGLSSSPEAITDGLGRTVRLVTAMESKVPATGLVPMPGDIHPTKRALSGRKANTSLMVFVAILGGLVIASGMASGGSPLVQLYFGFLGACVVLIAAATIGSSMLRDEQRRILDEFSTPPP